MLKSISSIWRCQAFVGFDVVKKFVTCDFTQEKMHDENFRFTLTTNGMLLDNELPEFANSEMINVVINLDGKKYRQQGDKDSRKRGYVRYEGSAPQEEDQMCDHAQSRRDVRRSVIYRETNPWL